MNFSNLQYYLKCISEGREPGDKWEVSRRRRAMEKADKEIYDERRAMYRELWPTVQPERPVKIHKPKIEQTREHKNAVARAWYRRLKDEGKPVKKNVYISNKYLSEIVNRDLTARAREKKTNARLMAAANRRTHNRIQREYERSLCPIHWVQKRPYSNGKGKIKHKCPVCVSEHKKDWRFTIKGAESDRIGKMLRKHRERAAGELTKAIIYKVFKAADNSCECCGSRIDLTLDHKLAIAKGGTNDITNLGVLCRSCNSSKGSRPISYEELRKWLGLCA